MRFKHVVSSTIAFRSFCCCLGVLVACWGKKCVKVKQTGGWREERKGRTNVQHSDHVQVTLSWEKKGFRVDVCV